MKNDIFFALKVGFWSHIVFSVIFYCLLHFKLERVRSTLAFYAFSKTRISRNVRNGTGCSHRNSTIVHL